MESDITELKLRNGQGLSALIGPGSTPTPTLTRSITGSSSLQLSVYDPELNLLDLALLSERFDVQIDGLHFRYLGASKSGKNITLTFEDREVARLREYVGPKKAYRKEMTRAEFIIGLVRELKPEIPTFCPKLHDILPIENRRQGKKAADDAKANRSPGLGATKGLTMDGVEVSSSQIDLGETALRIAESGNAPYRARVALIEALMAESGMGVASPGNVLQALGSGGAPIGTAEEEIGGFLFGKPVWTGVTAVGYLRENPSAPAHVIAQAVQKSAFSSGSNYAKFEAEAREWVETFSGIEGLGEAGDSTETTTEPFTFEVKKSETYWAAIQRLAKEVNWRAFIVAGRFFYIDEIELLRGQVRLAIDRDSQGIEGVDFDFNHNKVSTEITVRAYAKQWKVPPGAVVTLAGYGPASIGFGGAPLTKQRKERLAKGKAVALSQNRNAVTKEGRGRYLVDSIETPLGEDSEARLATVTLKRATQPLPEKAAATKTVSTGGATGDLAGSPVTGEMGVLEGTPEDIVNQVVEYANANGFPAVTPESVRSANASHGPTISGGTSDHQGPPEVRWAADISNGTSPTTEMTHLAAAISNAFNIPWDGAGLVSHSTGGYRLQLIYKTMEGGDHYNHVHFGCAVG